MPHALVRQADGSFDFKEMEWSGRGAGNDDTNPMPSFVDSTINDVFFDRNRLGFLSGENVIMSRSAGYFAFFLSRLQHSVMMTQSTWLVSHPRISILKYAVPFSEQLLLWSDEVQFVMTSSGVLTAKSIQLDVGSEFALGDNA
ncbi:non-contractile tail tubular protein [Enterobacter phage 01_vB_Eclo_IJM]|nr:non-contractile tail tubular protein [Enterobacter phage 01_vB_Eclo_IJM]